MMPNTTLEKGRSLRSRPSVFDVILQYSGDVSGHGPWTHIATWQRYGTQQSQTSGHYGNENSPPFRESHRMASPLPFSIETVYFRREAAMICSLVSRYG